MTSVDLLITLGGKIADVLLIMLKKRVSKKEKEEAEILIDQYNTLRESHKSISTVLQQYNQGIVHVLATHSLQNLYPICTHRGYQRIEKLYHQYLESGITQLLLDKLEVLSINLVTYEIQEMKFSSSQSSKIEQAKAYTHEVWISSYANGVQDKNEVINIYMLEFEDGNWKINSAEVYSKNK